MKTLVLGFDAIAPDLAFPWTSKGILPTLGKLIEEGVWGQLESTPNTSRAAAWSCFATGLDPGKHGIFHDASTLISFPDLNLNAHHRHGETFWKNLSDLGYRVGVINVPMTYPVEAIEGFVIARAESPSPRATGFSHPLDFFHRVSREMNHTYCIEADIYQDVVRGQWQKASQKLSDCLKARCEFTLKASSIDPTDILVAVFTAADTAQQLLWQYSGRSPDELQALRNDDPAFLIQKVYRHLDDVLAELVEKMSPEIIIVMSSRGTSPDQRRSEYLFSWLKTASLLNTLSKHTKSQRWFSHLYKSAQRVINKRYPDNRLKSLAQVDWSNTKAYCVGTDSIYINLYGREPQGIVPEAQYEDLCQDIANRLLTTVEPATQMPVVETVKMGRDIYDGPFAHRAPDIVIQWRKEGVSSSLETLADHAALSDQIPLATSQPHGIFVAAGPGIRKGTQIHGARVTDLAPTILHLFGTSVPDHMDGQVLTDIFEPKWLALHPVTLKERVHRHAQSTPKQADDIALVEERLRGLGYID